MKVTMVKKRLADGSECRKCGEATDFLKTKGVWSCIDEIVWYDESEADSEGQRLATEHGMTLAPFFLIERRGNVVAVDSVMRVYRML